jgi:hypothetical protein
MTALPLKTLAVETLAPPTMKDPPFGQRLQSNGDTMVVTTSEHVKIVEHAQAAWPFPLSIPHFAT